MISTKMVQQCQTNFNILRSKAQLPPLIQLKLSYLLGLIKQAPIEQKIMDNLPDFQRISLQQMNKQTQIGVFCGTLNCFSGNIVYFQNERAYLRKDKLINFWNQCLVSSDSEFLRVKMQSKSNQVFQFDLSKTKISKSTKKYKGKNIFGMIDCTTNKKYIIGFQTQTGCQRIHQTLRQIVAQKNNKYSKNSIKAAQNYREIRQQKKETSDLDWTESQFENSFRQKQLRNYQQAKNGEVQNFIQQIYNQEDDHLEEDYLKIFKDQIENQQFNNDEGYCLERNFNGGRIMRHSKQKLNLKCTIFMNSTSALKIIESYFKLNQWNSEVEEYETLSRIDNNSYLIYIKFKKRNYLSYQRDSVCVFSAFKKSEEKYYIILKSIQDTSEKQNSNIKARISQLIQLSVKQKQQKACLITIIQKLNYLGYTSESDNLNSGIQFLKNIQFFPKFVLTQSFSQPSQQVFSFNRFLKSNSKGKFNQGHSKICDKSLSFQEDLSSQIRNKSVKMVQQKPSKQNRKQSALSKLKQKQQHFQDFMLETYTWKQKPEPKFLELLMKNQHEYYYLKHHFTTEAKYDIDKMKHSIEQPNNFIFQNGNWKFNSKGNIAFANQQILKEHNNVLKFVIKKLSSNLMSGESILNIPLPVQIFQGQSMLQRHAYSLGYMPKFIVPASQDQNIVQQIKKIILFLIGKLRLLVNISKPFNPVIGQTFQAKCGGIPIYLQQTSHHPPISSLYVNTQDFQISMNYDMGIGLGMNVVHAYCVQTMYIKMKKSNRKFYIHLPNCDMQGIMYGDRTLKFVDKIFIYEPQSLHFAQVSFQKVKKGIYQARGQIKANQIFGGIFKVKKSFGQSFMKEKKKHKFEGIKADSITQIMCDIRGSWLGDVFLADQKRMTLYDPIPNKLQLDKFVLPSDSNLRPDIYYKRTGDLTKAQQQKQLIENEQRRHRKLRKEMAKK